jgi:hypothetical protein
VLTELVRPLMSYGKDERDIDKAVWQLPIPLYKPDVEERRRLSQLGQACAEHVAAMTLPQASNFVAQRRAVRAELAAHPVAAEANELVDALLTWISRFSRLRLVTPGPR